MRSPTSPSKASSRSVLRRRTRTPPRSPESLRPGASPSGASPEFGPAVGGPADLRAVRAVHREALEAGGDAGGHTRAHADARGGVLTLHLASHIVQLRQAAALSVRHEQVHRAQAAE